MQTSVSAGGQAIGVAGQIADSGPHDIVSGFSKESSSQVPFGFGLRVQAGSNGDAYLLPTGFSNVGGNIAGLSVFDLNHAKAGVADSQGVYSGDLGASGLLPNASLQVGRKGRYLVPVEANVLPGDRAWCRGIGTGALTPGIWAGSGYGASYHIDCTAQAVFRSTTYTALDGVTKVAIMECDFTSKPA